MFKSRCQACESIFKVKDDAVAGRRARCPRCGEPTLLEPLIEKPQDDDLGLGDMAASDGLKDFGANEDPDVGDGEPLRFPPRGGTKEATPPPKPTTFATALPRHWLSERLDLTATIWECLAVVFGFTAVALLVLSMIAYLDASDADHRADVAAVVAQEYQRADDSYRPRVSAGLGEFPLRLQSAASTGKAYVELGAAMSSSLAALIAWTAAGFLRSASLRHDR